MKHFYLVDALYKSFYEGYYSLEVLSKWSRVVLYQVNWTHEAYSFKKLTIKRRL